MSLKAVYLREGRTEKIAPHYAELDSRLLESIYGVVGFFVRRSHDLAADIDFREKILEGFKNPTPRVPPRIESVGLPEV